jgi:GR25 family glycosyltransferase involved in LPS biosynthesis
MKYSIMQIDDRAQINVSANKEKLKDFEYVDIEYFNGNINSGWDSINSRGIPLNKWKPYDGRTFDPLPGEYGVWVSTILFFEYMINNSIDTMMLLEDDIILENNFVKNLNKCLNDLPKNFDFLSLYSNDVHNWVDENTEIGSENIHRSLNQFSAALGTVYSLNGAKKILKVLKRKGIEYTSDCFIFNQSKLGVIDGYSIKKENIKLISHDSKNVKSLIDPENIRNTED